tara:strand:- start:463 stop:684 length:222 start_codon:yes stop_codon:yes gene_type:complete
MTVAVKSAALPLFRFQLMVHVTKHHQLGTTLAAQAIDGQSEITIPPVTGWSLPIPAAGITSLRPQSGRSAVRK